MKEIGWNEFNGLVKKLCDKLPKKSYEYVYGVPTGGWFVANKINEYLKIPLFTGKLEDIKKGNPLRDKILVVDDLVDSGHTLGTVGIGFDCAALVVKKHSYFRPNYYLEDVGNDWIQFPWDKGEIGDIHDNIRRMIQFIGDNPNRDGLKGTPERVAKSLKAFNIGYSFTDKDVEKMLTTDFKEKYNGMILYRNIDFISHCEHHLVPFVGQAHIAYIPSKDRVVGVSKLARVLDVYAKRLQIQERIGRQVANAIEKYVKPLGVGVIITAKHTCCTHRGVQKPNGEVVTSELRGVMLKPIKGKPESEFARQEFLRLITI